MTIEDFVPENRPDRTPTGFDYSTLAADVADEMRTRANRIRDVQRASVRDVGRELIAAKGRVDHGCFVAWVRNACQMHIRTAERAMRAAELVGKHDKLSYLPPDGLLALASRSTPQPVVNEMVGEIAAGETPSAARIKRRIAEAIEAEKRTRIARPEEVLEGSDLQDRQWSPAEQAAVTNELVEMLVTWDRFDEFIALLETADLSIVKRALKNRHDERTTGTVAEGEAVAKEPKQIALAPSKAAAATATVDIVEAAAAAASLAAAPESSAGVSS
jgi:Protein of unknown function (DUF3102)